MDKQTTSLRISVIVPIYNEERDIEACVHSLLEQDLLKGELEILLVDGMSTDRTGDILQRLQAEYPGVIRVLQNPKRIQAAAMNIGAAAARGEFLIRVDAHAEYPREYCARCVALLEETGAQNAGCVCETAAKTRRGKVIAKLLTSPFGVGGAGFRVGAESGFTDTVPFGTFRKAYFQGIGGFDERLARSEDNEINYRIFKNGGKIYMTNEMHTTYYCRETVHALARMAFANGKWNVIAAKLCPGSMRLKYFVPLAFVLSLIGMPLLCLVHPFFGWAFGAELLLYLSLALYFALQKTRRLGELLCLWLLFPAFHIPYGIGSLCGIGAILKKARAQHEY